MTTYTVYFIDKHPKNGVPYIGCTSKFEQRITNNFLGHGWLLEETKILWETDDILDASIMEQWEQLRLLGESDKQFYHLHHSDEIKEKRGKSKSSTMSGENNYFHGKRLEGENNSFYGKTHSEESLSKMSEAHKNITDETRRKMSKPKSDEARKNMSIAHTGVRLSEETRRRMSEARKGKNNHFYGKTLSDEHRAKMSESMKGEKHPMYNKRHTAESIEKMRNKHWLNNGLVNARVCVAQIDEYMGKGFVHGRINKKQNNFQQII